MNELTPPKVIEAKMTEFDRLLEEIHIDPKPKNRPMAAV